MAVDIYPAVGYPRFPPTPPNITGFTLPKLKDLDLPLSISRFALPTPPLTPTQSFDSNHGGWLRRRSSVEEVHSEALTNLSRSALGYLEPLINDQPRKPLASNLGEPMIVSSSPLLPSVDEFMRGVYEMQMENQFQWNYGISRPPTPPSPVSSSSTLCNTPEPEESFPWSHARFPTDKLSAEFLHQKVSRDYELRKREARKPAIQNIQKAACFPTTKHQYRSDAGVKKVKTAAKKSKPRKAWDDDEDDEISTKRSNEKYTPTQECFIIYHKAEKNLTWKQLEEAYEKINVDQPHRSESALSCCYYRTNYNIPVTTPDGLLILRWDYSEERERQIKEEMDKVQERLDREYEKDMEEYKRRLEEYKRSLKEEAKQEGAAEENGEPTDENEEEKEKKKEKKDKTKPKKPKKPKQPSVPYPFSVHGDDGIPTVEYANTQLWVRQSGDVSLFDRFPEVLADERNTWVSPEDRERAKDIAARRLQQRLQWREWMSQHYPKILADREKKKKGLSAAPPRP
ncbi:hypothetical protein V8F20_004555 [Naviculisporaceae sp. PSN 640]